MKIDVCYCSPLRRASETAQIILAGRDVPIVTDERLREMNFGSYEGTENWPTQTEGPLYTLRQHPEAYCPPPDGESFEALFARTGSFLDEVADPALAQGKTVLIVGHYAMNESILCQRNGTPLSGFWQAEVPNCRPIYSE